MQRKKPRKNPEPEKPNFPAETHLNPYGFIFMRKKWLAEVGWPTGKKVDVSLDVQDGALIVKKKA